MGLQTEKINVPLILSFSNYYQEKSGIKPHDDKEDGRSFNSVKDKKVQLHGAKLIRNKSLSIIAASFLATSLLTVGSYKTEVLNKFDQRIKVTLQSLLKVASLILGLITANGFLNSIFPINEEDKKLKSY